MADLLSVSTVASLVKFQSLSPLGRMFAHCEMSVQVREALQAHGLDADLVFMVLREFQCILAGPFVLSLLDPLGMESCRSIDLICGHSRFPPLFDFLRRTCQATVKRRLRRIPDFPQGSYNYAYLIKFPHSNTLVRVIRSVHDLPQFLIPQYPATHLMNYVAADHVVIAYPSLTFTRRSIQVRNRIPPTLASSFTIGSRTEIVPDIDCASPSFVCGYALRYFNDPQTAVIGLQDGYVVNGMVHWQLGGDACNVNCLSDHFFVGEEP